MEIILKTDFAALGSKGDIINVKPGYARNYLIPQNIAIIANAANKKCAIQDKQQAAHKATKIKGEAEELAKKLENLITEIKVKASNEEGKIYGSINALQIAQSIKAEHKIPIESKNILIKEPIKTLGEHIITLKLHKDVSCDIKINVTNQENDSKEKE